MTLTDVALLTDTSYMKHDDMTWLEDSACKTAVASEADWYGDPMSRQQKLAISICNGICPVAKECLSYALRSDEIYGVWGGLTSKQRQTLVRKKGQLRKSELALRKR